LDLPDPSEARFFLGVESRNGLLPEWCLQEARICIQNPRWGYELRAGKKWLQLVRIPGYAFEPLSATNSCVRVGYRVETFLEHRLPQFIQSFQWGTEFPPRILFMPQDPRPIHVAVEVEYLDPTSNFRRRVKVRRYYLLTPRFASEGEASILPMMGAVVGWSLHPANRIGQKA
jgi:hypothetical protein